MNDFLESIYNAFTEPVLGIDANSGRILHCNASAANLLCRSANDISGKPVDLIVAEPAAFQSFLSEIRKKGGGKTHWQMARGDG